MEYHSIKDLEINEQKINQNIQLLDWVTSIYGIFWGAWLAFYVSELSDKLSLSATEIYLVLSDNTVIDFGKIVLIILITIGLFTVISVFTISFVRWLWKLRIVVPILQFNKVFQLGMSGFNLFFLVAIFLVILSCSFKINLPLTLSGLISTIGWGVISMAIVLHEGS